MDISRRKFMRFAPVSVGAVVLGVVALPEHKREMTWGEFEKATRPPKRKVREFSVAERKREFEIAIGDVIRFGDVEHIVRAVAP